MSSFGVLPKSGRNLDILATGASITYLIGIVRPLSAGHPDRPCLLRARGMVSLLQPLDNGAVIEVGMIGNEGFVGAPVLLGANTSPPRSYGSDAGRSLADACGRLP
jgi:hypothetical protein